MIILCLGIFVTSEDDVFEDPGNFNKVRSIINHVYKVLSAPTHMYGCCPYDNDRLVLHMNSKTNAVTCKCIEIVTSGRVPITKPVDWKFLSKPQQWQRLDCYYEFDEIYPIIVKNGGISVKQQFQVSI